MRLRIAISDEADEDLLGIGRYYRQALKRTEAGRTLVNSIYEEIARLPDNPYRRHTGNDLPASYRRAVVGSYIIFYRINETDSYLLAYHVRYRWPPSAIGQHPPP